MDQIYELYKNKIGESRKIERKKIRLHEKL